MRGLRLTLVQWMKEVREETEDYLFCIQCGNKMFGCMWKFHNESDVIDLDNLPQKKNILVAGKSIEAMVLDEIAKVIVRGSKG